MYCLLKFYRHQDRELDFIFYLIDMEIEKCSDAIQLFRGEGISSVINSFFVFEYFFSYHGYFYFPKFSHFRAFSCTFVHFRALVMPLETSIIPFLIPR